MFGLAATLFYVTYVLCGIPSNIMLAKVGARRWIAGIMVVWGIASTCTMFATSPETLYVLRMLVGIAEAGFLPGILVYLTWWFPAYHRARANALFMIAMPVTMMLGSILSGYILAMDGLWNLKGWQWLFLLEGLPSVVLGVVTWFYLNDTPDQATWLDEDEKQALKTMIAREQEVAIAQSVTPRSTLREVLTPAVLLYTLAYFCLTNTLSAINIWTPQILQSFNTGSSNIVIGLLAAIPQFCTILGMIWWSRRSDRLKERKKHTILPYLFAAAGWLLASATDHSLIQLLGIIMASTGSFTAMAIFWTTPDQVISLQSRAVALAVINAIGNVGSAVSPLLIGILRDATGSFSSGLCGFNRGTIMCQSPIANIDISKEYDESLGTDDVHYQSFARMAAFFGRDMQAHRHDQYFQMHFLDTGQIELQLDDHRYSVQAPLFVLTPPSVPHAFITESDSDGHVLTVREDLIWPLLEVLYPGTREAFGLPGICLSLADKPDELAALKHYWQLIARESTAQLPGREHTLVLLAQAVFTLLLRNAKLDDHAASGMRGELKLFQRFTQLIDTHYHQHWTVPEYASELHLTESRLTDICRRFANRSPKRLIFDRQLREARRLLLFSDSAVSEIAWQLGFKDPAYFARFFNRLTGCSPSAYRAQKVPVS
ncbi:hypothetical protein ID866_3106 [Astraeus odoratus]|nr:hypothetical protein ID866_3106 [Astraeus odoratus]